LGGRPRPPCRTRVTRTNLLEWSVRLGRTRRQARRRPRRNASTFAGLIPLVTGVPGGQARAGGAKDRIREVFGVARKVHAKDGAPVDLALEVDVPAVEGHDVLANGETQPGAAGL